jgi:hypothetical protein
MQRLSAAGEWERQQRKATLNLKVSRSNPTFRSTDESGDRSAGIDVY